MLGWCEFVSLSFLLPIFYDIDVWSKYPSTVFKRMEACYNKCIKSFFKYRRLDSVTDMLSELGLTTFSDLFHDNVVNSVADGQ